MLDHHLAQITVCLLDAPFGETTRVAEVLMTRAARSTPWVRAGAAHGGDDEIARAEPDHLGPDLDDLRQGFVADDQVVLAIWWRPVLERADLTVGPADADLEDAEHHLVGKVRLVGVLLDDSDLARAGKGRKCSHDPVA